MARNSIIGAEYLGNTDFYEIFPIRVMVNQRTASSCYCCNTPTCILYSTSPDMLMAFAYSQVNTVVEYVLTSVGHYNLVVCICGNAG